MTDAHSSVGSGARQRMLERHGAANVRALSGLPLAEYRAQRLRIDGKPAPFAAPYLAVSFADASVAQSRGVMDSLGLRLRYSDLALHRELSPDAGFARLVFDVLEHMRCESLYPAQRKGLRTNLDSAFMAWCQDAHGNGFADSEIGILLYTLIHMVRARLIGTMEDETAEALIEATRANLGPIIGKPLYQLKQHCHSQQEYAHYALLIANELDDMVAHAADDTSDSTKLKERHSVILPPDWDDATIEGEMESVGAGTTNSAEANAENLDRLGDYHVFTKEFDQMVYANSLVRAEKRYQLRGELDQLIKAQAVSVSRLAAELQKLLANPVEDGWLFGQDEGLIDARRLGQLVSNPEYRQVFVQQQMQLKSDAVVSFLIDNSGSMKRQRFQAVAVLLDTFCRALGLAGIATEVLGFTTGDWNGGKAMKAWRKAGQPADPGRLAELLTIVYKDADMDWRRARGSMACMLSTVHFREGVDGAALIWAYQRLQNRKEKRRYLVVISDGAPLDAATYNANREGFLADHLASVARFIERDPTVQLGAIGIDLDMSDIFRRSVSLDVSGTISTSSYRVLQQLYAGAHQS